MGFAVIPFLPLADQPVEYVTEQLFDAVWPAEPNWVRRHHEHDTKVRQRLVGQTLRLNTPPQKTNKKPTLSVLLFLGKFRGSRGERKGALEVEKGRTASLEVFERAAALDVSRFSRDRMKGFTESL
jgi:hypothetical protein